MSKVVRFIAQNSHLMGELQMPRNLVLGNGNILVNFDRRLLLRDLFFPYVGMENQVAGPRCGIGCWDGENFSWLDEDSWQKELTYLPDTLVSRVCAVNEASGLELLINDTVHYQKNVFLRRLQVQNRRRSEREVRLFFTQDLSLSGSDVGDTVVYDPTLQAVLHYKRNTYILVNGRVREQGIFQYATGLKRFGQAEGTWRDAEDGWLEGGAIAHGSVDSTVSFALSLSAAGQETIWYWLALGHSQDEVKDLNDLVIGCGPEKMLDETSSYWRHLVNLHTEFADLPPSVVNLYKQSILIIRTQCDNRGAILAANDADIMSTARDHYSYLWPRDGALVALALDRAGYSEVPSRFFQLCADIISSGGYYYQKYNPDGTVGSSWHPRVSDGETQLPIQEDETALVLYALRQHYICHPDPESLFPLYEPLVKKSAEFLLSYRDPATGLPLPSYDLWEERRGVFSFTCAAVWAGLEAAAGLAGIFGDSEAIHRYHQGSAEVKTGVERYLYSQELGRFWRGVYPRAGGGYQPDQTLDASLYGLFALGLFEVDDPRIDRTMRAVQDALTVHTKVGGVARYPGDWYFRVSDDLEKVPGNPWFITTLWLGEWFIARAKNQEELGRGRDVLEWAAAYALPTGVMSEQVHPYNGQPLSVAPLTWSHAAYLTGVGHYLDKYRSLIIKT
jgi:GH15 family glucan-1,4-alpha-glucosidase